MKPLWLKAVSFSALLAATSLSAQTWTQTFGPTGATAGIASSADGTKLVAVGFPSRIYTSTNSGASWITNGGGYITAVASSADGNTLVVCSNLSVIYVSTNAGMNWTLTTNFGHPDISALAISADGNKVVGAGAGKFAMLAGHIYTSTDSGTTWTKTAAPLDNWTSVACSADGNKIVTVSRQQRIVTSTNFGLTWATNNSFLWQRWVSVASSADGNRLAAASESDGTHTGAIYTSSDSGATWISNNVAGALSWSVASSADGQRLIAVYQNGTNIFTSADGGLNWTSNGVSGISNWTCASSADGGNLIADAVNGIWTLQTVPPPQLNLTSCGSNLDISWIVPSTNFVLQQSLDLTNWETLTNVPELNLTNLQNEVFLPPTNNGAFFRLSQ